MKFCPGVLINIQYDISLSFI